MRNKQEEISYKNLCVFSEIAKKHINPLILDGGALLGAYRDGQFCEDDWDDNDFTTFRREWDKVEALNKELIEQGFHLAHSWTPEKTKSGQTVYVKDGCRIDLMFKDFKDDRAWWCTYGPKGETYKSLPADFYLNRGYIDLYDLTFECPLHLNKYLNLRYGDWNKLLHRSQYSCDINDRVIVSDFDHI